MDVPIHDKIVQVQWSDRAQCPSVRDVDKVQGFIGEGPHFPISECTLKEVLTKVMEAMTTAIKYTTTI